MVSTFIIEEHHEAFFVWVHCLKNKIIKPTNNILFHFDDHSDMNTPRFNISINNLLEWKENEIKTFTYSELSIASFILPAIYLKIFNHVVWIKEQMFKELKVNMFVRSYNDEGLRLLSYKKNSFKEDKFKEIKKVNYLYEKIDTKNFHRYDFSIHEEQILDIDLDFFSCADDTYFTNEVLIETTKEEFDNFEENKYHMLRFITGRVQTYRDKDKFYFLFNYFQHIYPENRKVDEKMILERIYKFKCLLREKKITPKLITICRSRHSGFTPKDQWKFIEKHLISSLQEIYDLDIKKIESIVN